MENKIRWSAKKKKDVVIRLIRGETMEELSREYNIPIVKIVEWQKKFLEGGEKNLAYRKNENPDVREYQKLPAKTQMELELYKKKDRKNRR